MSKHICAICIFSRRSANESTSTRTSLGRFGPSAEYNVNGDLTGALDMVITGPVYVKETSPAAATAAGGREVIKLLRRKAELLDS